MPLSYNFVPPVSPSVLVIGAMNMDVQAIASRLAIPGDSTPGRVTSSAGGVGRNIAEGLARLGVSTSLVTAVADDVAGGQLVSHCKAIGVSLHIADFNDSYNTPSYVSVFGEDGSLLCAVNDMLMIDQLNFDRIAHIDQLIAETDLCVVDSNLPEQLITRIADSIDNQIFVADAVSVAKCIRLRNALSKLSLLKVNLSEAQEICRFVATTSEEKQGNQKFLNEDLSVDRIIEQLLQLGPDNILITLGQEGALLASEIGGRVVTHRTAAPEVEVVNVNGAGDALMAGVLAAVLYGEGTEEQLRWGTVCAGYSLSTHKACSEQLSIPGL